MPVYQQKRVLVTVKTYPTPASKGAEVSCTAGITDDGKWIRLFPIPFRFMEGDKQFEKYQWIEVAATKSSDPRKESFEADIDSLRITSGVLTTKDNWKARKEIVLPLQAPSLCHLRATRKQTGDTLGIFKPKTIHKFIIESDTPSWRPEQLEKLLQLSVYDKQSFKQPLEKIPYKFFYEFTCDAPDCRSHKLLCVDWELGQAYRRWRKIYGSRWEWAIFNKFETDMILRYNTYFVVGTMHGHPGSWIIIGLFYPPR